MNRADDPVKGMGHDAPSHDALGVAERARARDPSASQSGSSPAGGRRLDAGYEIRLAVHRGGVNAKVISHRSTGSLRLAEGRPVTEAAGLAGMLSPLNAAAHTAAALSAAEAALRIEIAPEQIAARQLLIGFEVAAACAWRMGLAWPQLTGATAHAGPVQAVRAAADAAAEAIYENGDWARLGGGAVQPQPARLFEFLNTVRRAFRQLGPTLDDLVPHAPALGDLEGRSWPLLDDAGVERAATALADDPGYAARPHLAGKPVEESPRAILQLWDAEDGLGAWFRAQARFAAQLPERLERTMRAVRDHAPETVNVRGSGRGWGMAVTSRGRLIHWMAIERGRVRAWRAIEPTDWNFAPKGPVAQAAALLEPEGDLADAGRWVAAAFDPSAPCKITVQGAQVM